MARGLPVSALFAALSLVAGVASAQIVVVMNPHAAPLSKKQIARVVQPPFVLGDSTLVDSTVKVVFSLDDLASVSG